MFPMFYVSQLASRRVKVSLGGQAADELFGGYARYALAHPARVVASWFRGRGEVAPQGDPKPAARVGGNLLKQLLDRRNVERIVRTGLLARDWRGRYFANFAKLGEAEWLRLFSPAVVSRAQAWDTFAATLARSPATDPADKLMHWDLQTYLPGLFQQDDRMSMANGLESRVPLADPRLVRFAFHSAFDLKLRGGATKWLLRKAVADVLPGEVLNRRKVGFDTPTERWMRSTHREFVRETLLSSRARSRGFWSADGLRALMDDDTRPGWNDLTWKVLAVETWARVFLDRDTPAGVAPGGPRAA
jgi:asparagine synthase (glutamine-hydrolysing)